MKSIELRMCNWVNHKAEICKVWSLSQEWLRVENEYSKAVSYDHIFGIPLTHEILEKAVFEFDNIAYWRGKLMLSQRKDGDWAVWYGTLTHGRLDECNITYLHQLQNIYHALTGQELNIEL